MFEVVKDEFRKYPKAVIKLPERGTHHSMAYDIRSPIDVTIEPHKFVKIFSDIKVKIPSNYGVLLNVRSSVGLQGIMLMVTQGWIDRDYYGNPSNDGNIMMPLYNFSDTPFVIHNGDRICQAMIVRYMDFGDIPDIGRTGGFGSTGVI